LSTKTCQIKRNQRNPTKNSYNPTTPNTPKSSPFAHGFGRGIKGKRTTNCSCIYPLEGEIGNLCHLSIGRMHNDCELALPRRKPCDPDVCPLLRSLWTASSHTGQTGAPHQSDWTHRSDRSDPPVRPVWSCCISVIDSLVLALLINQGT
jgi:hypothetical protein